MARPIAAIPAEVHEPVRTLSDSGTDPAFSPSLEKVVFLLEQLDKAGILNLLIAAVEQRNSLLGILVDEAVKPGSKKAIKNATSLIQTLSSIDTETLTALGEGMANGVDRLKYGKVVEVRGVWDVLKASRDPDISRAFSVVLTILKSMGKQLRISIE